MADLWEENFAEANDWMTRHPDSPAVSDGPVLAADRWTMIDVQRTARSIDLRRYPGEQNREIREAVRALREAAARASMALNRARRG